MSADTSSQSPIIWGNPLGGLRLGIGVHGSDIELQLQNVGPDPLEVLSHVQAQETHLDWFRLILRDSQGGTRELRLMDDRDKSAPVRVNLEPGASLRHAVSLTAWAQRSINGSQPIQPGSYQVSASYETPRGSTTWAGRLEAGPIDARIGTLVRDTPLRGRP